MKRIVLLLGCVAVLTLSAVAGEIKEIELSDGSVITGEVLSLNNGVYKIRTATLGDLTVEESKVLVIRSPGDSFAGGKAVSTASSDRSPDIHALQQEMMNDRQVMDMIQSLQDDPQFKEVMADPAIMQAVNSGDVEALMNNPKFLELMQNATVKDIQERVAD
ncbi:MAG: hypothetical protein ACOZF0_15665 [Thermodesulfobacteriota bacterium]